MIVGVLSCAFSLCLNSAPLLLGEDKEQLPLVLVVAGPLEGTRICKGVAVGSHTILTAAHCLQESKSSDIKIRGENGWTGTKRFSIHPNFDDNERLPRFDIALISTSEVVANKPLSIFTTTELTEQSRVFAYGIGGSDDKNTFPVTSPNPQQLSIANPEQLVLDSITLKRDHLEHREFVDDFANRLRANDPIAKKKVEKDFGGFAFSLFRTSGPSLCRGDSGSPALIDRSGRIGVVAIGLGRAAFDSTSMPECQSGGTSVFTLLNSTSTINFIRNFDSTVHLE